MNTIELLKQVIFLIKIFVDFIKKSATIKYIDLILIYIGGFK